MALTYDIAQEASDQYAREYDRYEKLAGHVAALCSDLVQDAQIQATVQHRAKDPRSFQRKLIRYIKAGVSAETESVSTARDALELIGDLAGVRVATYVEADRGRVVELIRTHFRGPLGDGSVDVDQKTKRSGYRATHCQVLLPIEMTSRADVRNIAATSAEIQVCSMLAHVWNEIEHDMRYKIDVGWGADEAFRDQVLAEFHEAVDEGDDRIEVLLGLRSDRLAGDMCDDVASRLAELAEFRANGRDVLKEFVRLGYSTVDRISDAFLCEGCIEDGRQIVGEINVAFDVAGLPDELKLSAKNADVLLALLLRRHAKDLAALYERQIVSGNAMRTAQVAQALLEHEVSLASPREWLTL